MRKRANPKARVLRVMQILLAKTDEQHPITSVEIISELENYGIEAERKAVYDDIEILNNYGLDIENRKKKPAGYYVGSREFELAELKLLVDAVQSSKFITAKKSRELIKKLESLASVHDAKQLQHQVYVADRIKSMNESIYYNVDEIHSAITSGVKISFQYFEWTMEK